MRHTRARQDRSDHNELQSHHVRCVCALISNIAPKAALTVAANRTAIFNQRGKRRQDGGSQGWRRGWRGVGCVCVEELIEEGLGGGGRGVLDFYYCENKMR